MNAPLVATAGDVRDLWVGSEEPPADDAIMKWLAAAETIIFAEYPQVKNRLADDTDGTWAARIRLVASQMVIKVLKNPNGVRQYSRTAGVFTEATTYGAETIEQELALTPTQRTILQGSTARNFGIDMTPPPPPQHPLLGAWVNGPTPPGIVP